MLKIGHLLDRLPSQISGGQQQRTSLARALVYPSRVYLFDEPLSNLDAKLRLEARGFLNHLQRDMGMTAVYVTHDQAEAMALATRIAVMDQGRIVQYASPIEIYRRPGDHLCRQLRRQPADEPGRRSRRDAGRRPAAACAPTAVPRRALPMSTRHRHGAWHRQRR